MKHMKAKSFFLGKIIFQIFLLLVSLIGCKKEEDGVPVLETNEVVSITHVSAITGGRIESDGGAEITEKGVCWSSGYIPTIEDSKTIEGDGMGFFDSKIVGLNANTSYYVRAYATNSNGTSYGSVRFFETCALTFTDLRDGNIYNTVTIGDQIWMSENLKYLPKVQGPEVYSIYAYHCYVYGYFGTDVDEAKSTSNYEKYGVLYNLTAAKNSCPEGWRLPNDADWSELENYLVNNGYNFDGTVGGGTSKIAKALASSSGWLYSSNVGAIGNNDYPEYRNKSGFNALPGNYCGGGSFQNISKGYWWSATASSTPYYSSYMSLNYNWSSVERGFFSNDYGFSVRCIKD